MTIGSRWLVVLLLVCGAMSAQEPQQPVQPTPQSPEAEQPAEPEETPAQSPEAAAMPDLNAPPEYALRIGAGDLLEVKIYDVPEWDSKVRVSNRGVVNLPLVGAIEVAGLTIDEAEDLVAQRYVEGQFLTKPHVSVFVSEYATQGVSVLGEVEKPGVYPVYGPRNLFDVISAAGGVTDKAGKFIDISRRGSLGAPTRIEVNSDGSRAMEGNVPVYPGDTVLVHKAGLVYVVGDVFKPGGFIMENNESLTVLQAIALAQGTNKTAALKKAKLIRRTENGSPVEIPISLDKILAAKAEDMKLQPDDIVFVPYSAGKHVALRSIEAVIQTATGIAVYRR
jgi:polysaccharide export outer membrane protein